MTDQSVSHGHTDLRHTMSGAVAKGLTPLGNFAAKAGSFFGAGIRNMQFSRLVSFLNSMSDSELEGIDLKRSDIRKHAAEIIGMPPR